MTLVPPGGRSFAESLRVAAVRCLLLNPPLPLAYPFFSKLTCPFLIHLSGGFLFKGVGSLSLSGLFFIGTTTSIFQHVERSRLNIIKISCLLFGGMWVAKKKKKNNNNIYHNVNKHFFSPFTNLFNGRIY